MDEYIQLVAAFLSAVLGGLVSIWVAKKYMFSAANLEESLETATEVVVTNENLQKKLYYIGAVLGQGVKQGIGLSGGKGKFRWEDLAAQILPNIIGGIFPPAKNGEVDSSQGPLKVGTFRLPWEQ